VIKKNLPGFQILEGRTTYNLNSDFYRLLFENHLSPHHRHGNLSFQYFILWHFHDILVKNSEVSRFAYFNRAFEIFLKLRIGTV
jgi:hypothetical protein